jgi:hypothetical protein
MLKLDNAPDASTFPQVDVRAEVEMYHVVTSLLRDAAAIAVLYRPEYNVTNAPEDV